MNSKPGKFIPALYGGIVMAIISTVPFLSLLNCLCCAGILLGGVLAVFFYKNNFTPDTPPFTAGDCMGVGALAGMVGAVVGTFLSAIFISMFGNVMGEFILDIIRNMNIEMPEEYRKMLEDSVNMTVSPMMMAMRLFGSMLLYTIFGLLGGLIGYGVYKPKHQVMPTPPMPRPS